MKICPVCGSKSSAEIMYGYPDLSNEQLSKDVRDGKVAFGGCDVVVGVEQPTRRCNDCGNEFEYMMIE